LGPGKSINTELHKPGPVKPEEFQKNEITEYHIYTNLAKFVRGKNSKILEEIAQDELKHYKLWKEETGKEIGPDRLKVEYYTLIAKIFGLSFGLRLMEQGESNAQVSYSRLPGKLRKIGKEEEEHEEALLKMIEEERVIYAGSIVLGLNDALVELTGALAGLTFVIKDPRLIAMTGLVTGVAASMSMAASDYLSTKEDRMSGKNPLKSSIYTGSTYIITVILLIAPYLIIGNLFAAMFTMIAVALSIVFSYTFYITTAKGEKFWPRFIEMAVISLVVALISFGVGFLVKSVFGLDA